ncbi:serine/threonine kinase [Aureococcus anophagefferens]|nr:serine/threonine kinase [Aureococcus anophagefferens]
MGVAASMKEVAAYCEGGAVGDRDAFLAKYDFDGTSLIAEGNCGKVYACANKETSEACAVKCISMAGMDTFAHEELRNEVHLLKCAAHPGIVKLHDYCEDAAAAEAYVVTELLEGGEVFDQLIDMECYAENDARAVVAAVARASRTAPSCRTVLKTPKDQTSLKLCDFGFAVHESNEALLNGEPPFGADADYEDEVLESIKAGTRAAQESEIPNFKGSDLGHFPLAGAVDLEPLAHASADARDFVAKCLVSDPAGRLTAKQALLHPWFLQAHTEVATAHLEKTVASFRKNKDSFRGKKRLKASATKLRNTLRASRPSFAKLDAAAAAIPAIEAL